MSCLVFWLWFWFLLNFSRFNAYLPTCFVFQNAVSVWRCDCTVSNFFLSSLVGCFLLTLYTHILEIILLFTFDVIEAFGGHRIRAILLDLMETSIIFKFYITFFFFLITLKTHFLAVYNSRIKILPNVDPRGILR